MKKKNCLLPILCLLVLAGIGLGWWLSIPWQPFPEDSEITILAVRRVTVSRFSDPTGDELFTGLPDEDVDVTGEKNLELLASALRLLRTSRLPEPLFGPQKGGYLSSEIEYEIMLSCEDGAAYTLYVGNRYGGRLQKDGGKVYPLKDSAAWFALIDDNSRRES